MIIGMLWFENGCIMWLKLNWMERKIKELNGKENKGIEWNWIELNNQKNVINWKSTKWKIAISFNKNTQK